MDAHDDHSAAADRLTQAAFTVTALLSQVAATHDLSLTQLRVLVILRDHTPKVAELAAHLGLERSSVSGLIDRAQRRGLVRREASAQDKRVVLLDLTAQGRELAETCVAQIGVLLAPMIGNLGAKQQGVLAGLLDLLLGTPRPSTPADQHS